MNGGAVDFEAPIWYYRDTIEEDKRAKNWRVRVGKAMKFRGK